MDGLLKDFDAYAAQRGITPFAAAVYQDEEKIAGHNWVNKQRHPVFSVAKTITALAVLFAAQDGLLRLDEDILPMFGEAAQRAASGPILISHLLTMSSGLLKPLLNAADPQTSRQRDWTGYFFAQELEKPAGQTFFYSNANAYIAGRAVEKRCKETPACASWQSPKGVAGLRGYMAEKLFSPLGMQNVPWFQCPMGHTNGATGLFLDEDEMARIGLLLLGGGCYAGRRLLRADLV